MKMILVLALASPAFAGSGSIGITLPTIGQAPVVNAHPGAGEVVVFGDSLAAGYGGQGSAGIPVKCLAGLYPQSAVADLAVPGLTTAQILRKTGEVTLLKPKLIFVSAGGNDTIADYYKPGTYPAPQTLTELGQLFDQLIATGAVVAYLGLNPPYPSTDRLPMAADLARAKGVVVVDGMAGLWTNPAKMSDEFHPNASGYDDMCNAIRASVTGLYP